MTKSAHVYRITLEQVSSKNDETPMQTPLKFEFGNHDDIFSIIEKMKQRDLFNQANESTEFALGLKLFSEVILKNKSHPLFEEIYPALGSFMKKLKSST